MKQAYLAQDPIDAHMVQDLLRAEGIASVIQGEHLFAIRGLVPMEYPTVWVMEDGDYERARELIQAYEKQSAAQPGDTWTCPKCGEILEGQFDTCWQCGTTRPQRA